MVHDLTADIFKTDVHTVGRGGVELGTPVARLIVDTGVKTQIRGHVMALLRPSSDPDDPIAGYAWDFGDGHTQTTGTPLIGHNYTAPGAYTVRLTVADAAGCSKSRR